MPKNTASTLIEWAAIAFLAIWGLPRLLLSLRGSSTYGPGATAQQQASRAIQTAGQIGTSALGNELAKLLGGASVKPGGSGASGGLNFGGGGGSRGNQESLAGVALGPFDVANRYPHADIGDYFRALEDWNPVAPYDPMYDFSGNDYAYPDLGTPNGGDFSLSPDAYDFFFDPNAGFSDSSGDYSNLGSYGDVGNYDFYFDPNAGFSY